jgi:hypothetical protein
MVPGPLKTSWAGRGLFPPAAVFELVGMLQWDFIADDPMEFQSGVINRHPQLRQLSAEDLPHLLGQSL